MAPRIREGQAKYGIMRWFSEGAELATIGEQIVQREHWDRGSITARFVAQAVLTTRRKPRDPRSSGRLRSEGTPRQAHGETGLPARGDESMAGRRDSPPRAMRSQATSQTAPATRPPQTAVAVSTGKR